MILKPYIKNLNITHLITLNLLLAYILTPLYYLLTGAYHVNFGYPSGHIDNNQVSFIIIIIFLIGVVFAYRITPKSKLYFYSPLTKKSKLAFYLALIGVISWLIFVSSYGGLSYVLENISKIRSGYDENKNYLGAFIKIFSAYIEISFFIFFAYFMSKENKTTYDKIILIVFLLFVFTKLTIDGGRGNIINFLFGVLILTSIYKKISIKLLLLYSAFFLFIGLYGKIFIFQLFALDDFSHIQEMEKNYLDSFMSEYAHQFFNINIALSKDVLGERMFGDFYYWILKPLKLLGMDAPDSISYYTTFLIKGEWDSEVPPGIIAFSILQGGLLGLVLISLLSGFFIKKTATFFNNSLKITQNDILISSLTTAATISIPFMFLNSDPALYIQGNIHLIVLFTSLFILKIIKIKKI